MSWTKRELVNQAFSEIGLSNYIFDLEADEVLSAVQKMDSMLNGWGIKGIRVSYTTVQNANDTDPDQESGLPGFAVEAVYTNLAIRLAPSYGKQVTKDLRDAAREAYKNLLIAVVQIPEMQLGNTTPIGEGNKPFNVGINTYFKPTEEISAGNDSILDI